MGFKKFNIIKWNDPTKTKPDCGKLLLLKYWQLGVITYRFARYTCEWDGGYYENFPGRVIMPKKLITENVVFWAYMPEVK